MIHLLWCTIRPLTFIQMHSEWVKRASDQSSIFTEIAVNSQNDFKLIEQYLKTTKLKWRMIIVETNKIGVCYPSYKLSSSTQGKSGDIVVFASDDFLPPTHWDNYLKTKLESKDGGLMVRDGYQLPDSSNMLYPAITIPIMTWNTFEKLNKTIYSPVYTHMYSDCELYLNLKELDLLIDERQTDLTIFEHLHHAAGKRRADQLDVQYHAKWQEDEKTWNSRKNIPVQQRLTTP
jgi:hypothetical protein